MKNKRGFTLIEMVVVLAVVAILAAILTPTIAKNINDAKIARANNEVQVIAGAIGSFYKDTGRWPTSNGANLNDTIQLLYGPGDVPALDSTVTGEENWLSTGGWGATLIDTFANHLIQNDPKGGSVNYTDDTTTLVPKPELRWRGPYITEVKSDPWGDQYSCNIWFTFNATTNFVGVYSAGSDRKASTVTTQASTGVTIGGDDILYRIQ